MQFTTATLAAILSATSVFAAPTAANSWTLTDVKRVCNAKNTICAWSFGINANDGKAATACEFQVLGSPASHSDLKKAVTCGPYSLTAGWSGQFDPKNGFTTIAVSNGAKKQIAWPSYTDAELASGNAVKPNRNWAVTQM
ncbi:hypothetical protein F4808DRAFT_463406 [Astrocystis sublimbata]|nr:hypothetical protein F4808DRAFT_463406 [Astrocystis sublimbata]